jgi:hypothetical protein
VGAIDIASTSAVTTNEGRTGGTSGKSSSDDHAGKAGLPASGRQTHPISHLSATLSPVPSSVRATLINPNWHHAIEEEFAALIANDTWDLVPHPVDPSVVTGKWIFKHKLNFDGSLERYNAHWVLRGFTQ